MRRVAWLASVCVVVGLILLLQQGCGRAAQRVEVASAGVEMQQPGPGDSVSTGTTTLAGAGAPASTLSSSGIRTGPVETAEDPAAVPPAGTSSTSASIVSRQGGEWGPPAPEISGAFAEVSTQVGEMTFYVPGTLLVGSELHHCWWPASSGQEYDAQADSGEPNPHVSGVDASAEVRVLLKVAGGWVEILEGVHGDLGELPNEAAGEVAGHPARSYRLLGGHLVQWSDNGRWYAVYGRGVSADDVERVAQGMHVGPF